MSKSKNTPPTHTGTERQLFDSIESVYLQILLTIRDYCAKLRPFIKPTIYVFVICTIASLAIWRTNMPYIDDIHRNYNGGYAFSYAFGRHSSSILSYFLNMDFTLQNLSPITQIIAMFIASIACVIFTYVLCGQKIKYLPLTLSTLAIINPLILGCWMFQYDSPGMALSILASVVPILFWRKMDVITDRQKHTKTKHKIILRFFALSTISLLVMWTSYQSSSGILPLLVLTMCFVDTLQGRATKASAKKIVLYIIPYIASACIFLAIYKLSPLDNYRSVGIVKLSEFTPTIINNLQLYLCTPWKYLNGSWRLLIILLACSFIITVVIAKGSPLRHIRNFLLSIVYFLLALPASYGVYILLSSPASNNGESSTFGRTAIGLGFVLSLLCIMTVQQVAKNKIAILAVPGLLLLASFISYNTSFANAYSDQLEYNKFRSHEVVSDIARLYPDAKELSKKKITVYSYSKEYSGEMKKLKKARPIARLITTDMETWLTKDYLSKIPQLNTSVSWRWGSHYKKECGDSEVRLSTYYHTISEKGNGDICVYLK